MSYDLYQHWETFPIIYPAQCPHEDEDRQAIKEMNPNEKRWLKLNEILMDWSPTITVIRCGLCHHEFSRRNDYPMRAIWA